MDPDPANINKFPIVLVLCAVFLIVLSMLFSISESSFLSLNRLRLRMKVRKNDKRALRVNRLLQHKEIMLNTLLVANDLVNVLLSGILTTFALGIFGEKGIGIATLLCTVLLLIFGEITPKAVSTRHPDQIAYALSGFVLVVVTILRPIIIVFTAVSRVVLKILGIDIKKKDDTFTEEEIKTFIDVSAESGVLETSEHRLVNRVFKFTDLEASDIMIPRTKMICVKNNSSYQDVISLSEKTGFSRFPVYKTDIDDIVGIIYVKDLLFYSSKNFVLKDAMRSPLFILGTKKMSSLQQMLRENRQTIAIVVDEYGGTDGLLTKEDIAFEMFGATISEFNKNPHKNPEIDINPEQNQFELEGEVRLSDLNEILKTKFESEFNDTLAGFVMEKLERLPVIGDNICAGGYLFTVKKLDGHRIASIKVERINNEQDKNIQNAETTE